DTHVVLFVFFFQCSDALLDLHSFPTRRSSDLELKPRVFVETIDEVMRLQGRVVFNDYWTDAGTAGSPADSRGLISVGAADLDGRSEEHTSELQSRGHLVCRLLLEKKKNHRSRF